MKKIIAVLAIVSILVCSALCVSAASTKDDLIKAMEAVPAANNKVFHNGAVQMIKSTDMTPDQIDKLIVLLQKAKEILPENLGSSARNYSEDQVKAIFALMDEGCKIMGWSYTGTMKTQLGNEFGIILKDGNGNTLLTYTDGIIPVRPTGENDTINPMLWVVLGVAAVVMAAGAVVVIKRRNNA